MLISLIGYTPPARYDLVAWVSARIEEGDTETGAFTEVETVSLTFIDADPRTPQSRGLTTELATGGKFYRVVWISADGDESAPTAPEQFLSVTITTAFASRSELAALLKVDATTNATVLDRVLLAAAGEIRSEIGEGTPLMGWKLALATQVNLDRAGEHWVHMKSAFGFVGLGGAEHSPQVIIARDSWARHANKLAPLVQSWGIG